MVSGCNSDAADIEKERSSRFLGMQDIRCSIDDKWWQTPRLTNKSNPVSDAEITGMISFTMLLLIISILEI